jgi:hypothetical protein
MPKMKRPKPSWLLAFTVLLVLQQQAYGHTINYVLEKAPAHHVIWYYLKLGFYHIVPNGFDHILFVAGLCLLNRHIKIILWQATAFTVAHSITLALSMKNVIVAPGSIVEPIIAMSILFIAIENLLLNELKPWRIVLVFTFGLIHGLGFASSLNEIGLPRNKFFLSVFSFNAGVELGQIAVILFMFLLFVHPFGTKTNYRKQIVYPLSAAIALVAFYWTIERVFFAGI